MFDSTSLFIIGVALMLFGVILIFLAVAFSFSAASKEKEVKGGGAIIIGPFPIVFGTDKESVKVLLILSIVLMVLGLVVLVFLHFLLR